MIFYLTNHQLCYIISCEKIIVLKMEILFVGLKVLPLNPGTDALW